MNLEKTRTQTILALGQPDLLQKKEGALLHQEFEFPGDRYRLQDPIGRGGIATISCQTSTGTREYGQDWLDLQLVKETLSLREAHGFHSNLCKSGPTLHRGKNDLEEQDYNRQKRINFALFRT